MKNIDSINNIEDSKQIINNKGIEKQSKIMNIVQVPFLFQTTGLPQLTLQHHQQQQQQHQQRLLPNQLIQNRDYALRNSMLNSFSANNLENPQHFFLQNKINELGNLKNNGNIFNIGSYSTSNLLPINNTTYSSLIPFKLNQPSIIPGNMLAPLTPSPQPASQLPLNIKFPLTMSNNLANVQIDNKKISLPENIDYQLPKKRKISSPNLKSEETLNPTSQDIYNEQLSPNLSNSLIPTGDKEVSFAEAFDSTHILSQNLSSSSKKKRKGPYLRSACVSCYDEKVKCCPSNIIDESGNPGPCERCIQKNRKCVKVLEKKRGRKSKEELGLVSTNC